MEGARPESVDEMGTGSFRLTAAVAAVGLLCLLAWSFASSPRIDGQPPLIEADASARPWECRLEAGVNYFALPVVPYDASWESLFGRYVDAVEEVAAYDAVERRWVAFHPEAPPLDETDHAPSLVFRVQARRPVVLHFEGARFDATLSRLFPLKERLRLLKGWNVLGASWDENLDVLDVDSDPATPCLASLLEAQGFRIGTDLLRIYDPVKQIWEDLDTGRTAVIEPGRVLIACKDGEKEQDPYDQSPDADEAARPHWGSVLAGRDFGSVDMDSVDLGAYGEDGDPFSFGSFKMAGHVFKKGDDGKPAEGRCLVVLPEALRGFTDLPPKIWAKVLYSGEDVQKVVLDDVKSVTCGPSTTQSKTVTAIDELFITPEGLLYGTGKLKGQAVSGVATATVDVGVQIVWNEAWPSYDPADPTCEKLLNDVEGDEKVMPALELEVPLEEDLMGLLRWERRAAGADVVALDGWRMALTGERAKKLVWSQVGHARDVPFGMKATLSAQEGNTDLDPWRPMWILPDVDEASIRPTRFDVKSVQSGIVVLRRDWFGGEYSARVYETGLVKVDLNSFLACNLYGNTVDFEFHWVDEKCSLHLMYDFSISTNVDEIVAEGKNPETEITFSPAIFLEGHDFDIGPVRIERLVGGVDVTGTLKLQVAGEKGLLGNAETFMRILRPSSNRIGGKLYDLVGGDAATKNKTFSECFKESKSNMASGSSINIGAMALARIKFDERKKAVTALVRNDLSFEYDADENGGAGGFIRRNKLKAQLSYSEAPVDVEGAELPLVSTAGASVEWGTSSKDDEPEHSVLVSLMADLNMPQEWGMSGQSTAVHGLATYRWEKSHPDADEGNAVTYTNEVTFTLASEFMIALDKADELRSLTDPEAQLSEADREIGLGVDFLRFSFLHEKTGTKRNRELKLALSGLLSIKEYDVDRNVTSKGFSFTGFGSLVADETESLLSPANLDFMVTADFDLPIPGCDHFRFDQFFFGRMQSQWSLGLAMGVKTPISKEWGQILLLPQLTPGESFSFTASLSNLQLGEVTLESAFLRLSRLAAVGTGPGRVPPKWDFQVGGIVNLEEVKAIEKFGLKIGMLVGVRDRRGSVWVECNGDGPQFGSTDLGFSFRHAGGTVILQNRAEGVPLSFDANAGFDVYVPWLRPNDSDDTPCIGMDFLIRISKAIKENGRVVVPGSWEFGAKATRLVDIPFSKTQPLNEGGGLSFTDLGLRFFKVADSVGGDPSTTSTAATKATSLAGGIAVRWEGTASLYTPKKWRDFCDKVGDLAGNAVAFKLPEKSSASFAGGIRPADPKEFRVSFEPTPPQVQFFDLFAFGIKDFMFRKASPWTAKASAYIETKNGTKIGGTIGNATDGSIEFRPSDDLARLELKVGPDLTLRLQDFCFSAHVTSPFRMRLAGRGEVDVKLPAAPDGITLGATIAISFSKNAQGDPSFQVALSDVVLPKESPIQDPRVSISASRETVNGQKKWSVKASVGSSLVIPDFFPPPLAGLSIDGTFEVGKAAGQSAEWTFVVSTPANMAELVLVPPPWQTWEAKYLVDDGGDSEYGKDQTITQGELDRINVELGKDGKRLIQARPYEVYPTAKIGFESFRIGMRNDIQGKLQPFIAGSVALTLGPPISRFLGKDAGEPIVFAAEAALEGGYFRFGIDFKRYPLDVTIPFGSFGSCKLGLEELYVSTQPGFAAKGGVFLRIIDFEKGCRFYVNYRPPQNFSFCVSFENEDGTPNPFVFGIPGIYTTEIKKLGYESIIANLMGVKFSGAGDYGSPLLGYGLKVEDFMYMPPNSVPPYGFPFFDEIGVRAGILGFQANGSVSFPFPRLPDFSFLLGLVTKVIKAFSDDKWAELKEFCRENKDQVEGIFRGPGVGNIFFLMPGLMKEVLPNLPEVEWEVAPFVKMKFLKLDLVPKLYYFMSLFPNWTDGIVYALQTLKIMILAIKDPRKVIAMVPPEKREGSFDFRIADFARIAAGYKIVDDQMVFASVDVPGTKEFARFHRIASHVEKELPSLKSIGKKLTKPVTKTMTFTDDEGEKHEVSNADLYVNLKDFMEEGLALKKDVETLEAQIAGAEGKVDAGRDFNERSFLAAHVELLQGRGALFGPSREVGVDALRAVHTDGRDARIRLHGVSAPFEVKWPSGGKSRFGGTMVFYGQTERAFDHENRRHRLVLRSWIDKVGSRLVLKTSGRVLRAKNKAGSGGQTQWENADDVDLADQWVYDIAERNYNPDVVVTGWEVFHPLGKDEAKGQMRFTDYGTMKIEAPGPTVITYQYGGSKLNKLRDALEYLNDLPVFDWDSNEYLLSTQFWVNLLDASAKAQDGERPWSIQGKAVRYVHDPAKLSGDSGAEEDEEGEGILDIRLLLQDIDYPLPGSTEKDMRRQSVSVDSDISSFYFKDDCLFAQPFRLKIASKDPDTGEEVADEQVVPDLLVLDGSQRARELLAQRKAKPMTPMSIFKELHDLGLNLSKDAQPMRIKRMQLDVRQDYLQVLAQPKLVVVMNNLYGGEMLRLGEGDAQMMHNLLLYGPYNDPDSYPRREGNFFVECLAKTPNTTMNTASGAELVDYFEQDLILRTLDLKKPAGLAASFDAKGNLVDDRLLAVSDGAWQGALKVKGLKDLTVTDHIPVREDGQELPELPEGVRRLVNEGEKVFFYTETPAGKPIQFIRTYGGSVEVLIKNRTEWESCKIELDEKERTTGSLRYPTGEIIPGGFFAHGILDVGQSSALRGKIDFQGQINTDGNFRFEGGVQIWVLGKSVAEARFIVGLRDGLYIYGKIDVGIARCFIEGRLGKNHFSLVGELDARIGRLLGVKAALTINPSKFELKGDVYVAGRRIFHGIIRISGSGFKIAWSYKAGRLGADADISFSSTKNAQGKVTSWKLRAKGKVWIKLWWPFGKHSFSFGFEIDSNGNFRVYFWKIYIQVNIATFKLSWGWD